MKRECFGFIVKALLLLGCFNGANAQMTFALGPKVGINFTSVSFDPALPTSAGRTTILFGSAFELMFANMFGVQIEPSYATKGATAVTQVQVQDDQGNVLAAKANATLGYKEIQIPVLFKVKFLTGPVKPYAIVGPNVGIVASAKINFAPVPGDVQFTTTDQDIKSETSGLDFGLDFGGGAEFRMAPSIALTGDVRYSLGLSNLYSPQVAAGQQVQASRKTRGFQVQLGALFSL